MPESPFASFIRGIANPGVPAELWAQLRPWLRRFALDLPRRSLPKKRLQYCDHVARSGNVCDHLAVFECRACGDLVCLEHAYIGGGAQAVCMQCVGAMASAAKSDDDGDAEEPQRKRKRKKRSGEGRDWSGKRAEPQGEEEHELRNAYAVLGLEYGSPRTLVHERFRELTRTEHPDRVTDPVKKAVATERFKKMSAAYSLLMNDRAA